MYYGGGDHKTADQAAYGCLGGRSKSVSVNLDCAACRLYARAIYGTKAPLQLWYAAKF